MEFISRPDIPRLAWGAVVSKGSGTATVYHGAQVEIRAEGFLEGAWDGPYEEFPPLSATVVCGSGGSLLDNRIRFCSGTDNVFPIHSITKEGKLFVSNSLIFCLALAGERPDPGYPFYFDDFLRTTRLGFNAGGRFRTASKRSVGIHFGHVMEVDRDLERSFSRFPICSSLPDYASYKKLLEDSVRAVLSNARSTLRDYPLTPVTACSAGYDANACAVFAKQASCRHAITFFEERAGAGKRDSGVEVARVLELECMEKSRHGYIDSGELAEFCVTPHAASCPYAAFEHELQQAILVTGVDGDNIWRLDRSLVFDDNRAAWSRFRSGYGVAEFRLRIGLVTFAVPHIGSIHNRDIHRISHSQEMKPWRIGGEYDRPIPRRILEDAGVPRQLFGMEKMASAQVHVYKRKARSEVLGPAYDRFMEQRQKSTGKLRDFYWKARYRLRSILIERLASTNKQYLEYTWMRQKFSFLYNRIPRFAWYYAFTFQYCFESLKGRYSSVVEDLRTEES